MVRSAGLDSVFPLPTTYATQGRSLLTLVMTEKFLQVHYTNRASQRQAHSRGRHGLCPFSPRTPGKGSPSAAARPPCPTAQQGCAALWDHQTPPEKRQTPLASLTNIFLSSLSRKTEPRRNTKEWLEATREGKTVTSLNARCHF